MVPLKWKTQQSRVFLTVWLACDWQVTTMTFSRVHSQIQSGCPTQLHPLVEYGHFCFQKARMSVAVMPNSRLQNRSLQTFLGIHMITARRHVGVKNSHWLATKANKNNGILTLVFFYQLLDGSPLNSVQTFTSPSGWTSSSIITRSIHGFMIKNSHCPCCRFHFELLSKC